MFDPVALAEGARQKRRIVHELEVGTALEEPLGQQVFAGVERRDQ